MEIGDRVVVDGQAGAVAFFGEVDGLAPGTWVGVAYDAPVGKNDGTVKGARLFACKPRHGHLVRPDKVRLLMAENAMRKHDSANRRGAPIGHASRAHEQSDAYMANFESAYKQLADPGAGPIDWAVPGSRVGGGGALSTNSRGGGQVGGGGGGGFSGEWGGQGVAGAKGGELDVVSVRSASASARFERGPSDTRGTLLDLSDRPNCCISVRGNEAVIGSTDHALYGIDIQKGRKSRTLYTKQAGHSEWVTCVTHLPDGRVLSGGMDSKLCLWNAAGAACSNLAGHDGSIAVVKALERCPVAVSAGYDKRIHVWDLSKHTSRALVSSLSGHAAPILCLSSSPASLLASGCRGGVACIWDLATGSVSRKFPGHGGHVTSVAWADESVVMTGAQDGKVRVWDVRADARAGNVAVVDAHVSKKGAGAVGFIEPSGDGATGVPGKLIVTAGADGVLQVLDPSAGFASIHALEGHRDFIYSVALAGGTVFSGGGDGSLLAHSIATGELHYALGANAAAVRCLAVTSQGDVVTSGDDGKALLYRF